MISFHTQQHWCAQTYAAVEKNDPLQQIVCPLNNDLTRKYCSKFSKIRFIETFTFVVISLLAILSYTSWPRRTLKILLRKVVKILGFFFFKECFKFKI